MSDCIDNIAVVIGTNKDTDAVIFNCVPDVYASIFNAPSIYLQPYDGVPMFYPIADIVGPIVHMKSPVTKIELGTVALPAHWAPSPDAVCMTIVQAMLDNNLLTVFLDRLIAFRNYGRLFKMTVNAIEYGHI